MKILAILTIVLLSFTLICGLWLRYSGKPVDPSSINFHMMLASLAILSSLVTSGFVLFTR